MILRKFRCENNRLSISFLKLKKTINKAFVMVINYLNRSSKNNNVSKKSNEKPCSIEYVYDDETALVSSNENIGYIFKNK